MRDGIAIVEVACQLALSIQHGHFADRQVLIGPSIA